MNLKPIHKGIAIQKCLRDENLGGIILPELTQEDTNWGVIFGVSDDCDFFSEDHVGDFCVFPNHALESKRLGEDDFGEETWVVKELYMVKATLWEGENLLAPCEGHVVLRVDYGSRDVEGVLAPDISHKPKTFTVADCHQGFGAELGAEVEIEGQHMEITLDGVVYSVVAESDVVGVYR